MQDEETDLSFADVNTSSAPKRPYTAPLLNDDPDNENAPDLAAEGVHIFWSTRPGSNRRPPRWQRGGGARSNAYLQLLPCKQLQGAAHGCTGDGSRLYPAPALGPAFPLPAVAELRGCRGVESDRPPPASERLRRLVQNRIQSGSTTRISSLAPMPAHAQAVLLLCEAAGVSNGLQRERATRRCRYHL